MPDETPNDMDWATLLNARSSQQFEQAQAGMREVARLLNVHHTTLIAQGFTDEQAFDLTLQFHDAWARGIFVKSK